MPRTPCSATRIHPNGIESAAWYTMPAEFQPLRMATGTPEKSAEIDPSPGYPGVLHARK